MKSSVVKRSIVLAGHKTSVSLEDAFWTALKNIAAGLNMTLSDLVGTIDSRRQHSNLSSAIRLFILDFYRDQFFARMGIENLAPDPRLAPDQTSGTESKPLERSVA
ncbi:MAG TPA: ribbon-helix-helix domain-containing protein [Xanthobacteraceae bacterium]